MKSKALIVVWALSATLAFGLDHIFGVGMALVKDTENGPARIKGVIPGGPAAVAGIQSGWLLLSIDGYDTGTNTLTECVALVRGEDGSKVRLELLDPVPGRTNKATITREKILIEPATPREKKP